MSVPHHAVQSGIAFWIHVSPRARRARIGGAHGDALRVAVQAPPAQGRANAACVEALAAAFGVPRAAVSLDPVSRGRRKRVQVAGNAAELAERLAALASPS
jgi:uncharacterized protein (TIGR00251 family)